ncbi:hypothetical protein QA640_34535 [Bradyrhizobium sp. CB82]|uniref:hypothetical protein n=1 Tax=Bradyrhizobium sp. CB82 TaxID=3039159 RepID=UPI0024B24596|nr:hypothetical protein [Bradyrhizobium sp. CB82]WFU39439.1 hypothetical protein QA640_34535 [Bradyrhizobium sp. CB82]
MTTNAVQTSLRPEKYRWRLPFFAEVHPGGEPTLPPISQAEMDLEIRQASFAGLDYWAFLAYSNEDPMSAALSKYLASRFKDRIKFCMFTELNRWGTSSQPAQLISEHISLMKRPEYVRVLDGRPLYYLGFIDQKLVTERWGSSEQMRGQIEIFRAQCVASGIGNPYIVLAGTSSEIGYWSLLGGDATGAYTISDPRGTGDYASLTHLVEQRWQSMSRYGLPVVPTVVTGWDRRPRIEHPVPWEHSQKPGVGTEFHFDTPTGDQIAEHLRQAIRFVSRQGDHRAPTILMYAWNENDEGGWLVPTVPCNTQRLEVLHDVLAPGRSTPNPKCGIEQ